MVVSKRDDASLNLGNEKEEHRRIPEILRRQDLIAVAGEAEREIKNDLQASLKGKAKIGTKVRGTC